MAKYTAGTRRHAIAQMHARGMTEQEIYDTAQLWTRQGVRPWVFRANVNGRREPKPLNEQLVELRHEISRTFSDIARSGNPISADATPDPAPAPAPDPTPEPKAKGKRNRDEEREWFYNQWQRIRTWIREMSERAGSAPIDSLDSMRPLIGARALMDEGISARTLVYAMTLHWPQASRDAAGIETAPMRDESESLGKGFHVESGYVRRVMLARQPCMLIGPAGSGKSHLARQVAGTIQTESHPDGLPYGETPLTPGATRGDLLGRHTLSGFTVSQFVEIYSGGGVFNFEEIDAADPSMLIVVNNALASDRLFNSANGEVYERHPDFIPVATANTFGLGADAKYTGREKLDLATIDRFRMGRVLVALDENLARDMILG